MISSKFTTTKKISAVITLLIMITALAACTSIYQANTPDAVTPTMDSATPTHVEVFSSPTLTQPAATPQPTVEPTYDPNVKDSWMYLPVIPDKVSQKMIDLYAKGQTKGNDPKVFSKVGDCETQSEFFLTYFDKGESNYNLGPYSELQEVLDQFKGSFEWKSVAAERGFSVSSVFSSLWSDASRCKPDEFPISCEYRIHRPAFVLISFGTNDVKSNPDTFERNMRALIEYSIKNNVVPILATKADNLEGDNRINETIARLAYEYEVPVWNFWRAMQPLPDHGLKEDQVHFTFARNDFSDPEAMKMGWPVRNLTALQVLDKVWHAVTQPNN